MAGQPDGEKLLKIRSSVNLSKCKEIVFRRPSVKLDILHLIRWLILSVFLVQSYLAYSLTVD